MPMKESMDTSDIRQRFLRFYRENGFQILAHSSLVDPMYPMTFVGSVGLTQIENAIEQGEDHAGERYATVQPCFRHFDIDKVGETPHHLSLFQMVGAFSFGLVGRQDTLGKIWQFFLTDLDFVPDRFWATYFEGGVVDGHFFAEDNDTLQAWLALGLPPNQIIRAGPDMGFWKERGGLTDDKQFRKCGVTTELFFDRGEQFRCRELCQPGCSCGRFVEVANILFIRSQIDQKTGQLESLVTPFDETVFGVERLVMALYNRQSVFDLGDWLPAFVLIEQYQQTGLSLTHSQRSKSYKVIADHTRALLFLTADGAPPPDIGGRARIMRKLIRAVITQQKILGIDRPDFTTALVDTLHSQYHIEYPHLEAGREKLKEYFAVERNRFEKTLSRANRKLERLVTDRSISAITGQQALHLVKDYGIPLSLLKMVLARREIGLNQYEYQQAYRDWQQQLAVSS